MEIDFYQWVIIFVAVIAFIYLIFFRNKNNEEEFKGEDFKENTKESMARYIALMGKESGGTIKKEFFTIGRINKIAETDFLNFQKEAGKETVKKTMGEIPKKKELKNEKILIIELGEKLTFFRKIMAFIFKFEFYDYLILRKDDIISYDSNNEIYQIKESVPIREYAGCFISSPISENYINDLSFQRTIESVKSEVEGFTRKIGYLEMKQAGKIERINTVSGVNNARWDNVKKNALSSDIEDDEV